MIVLVTGGREYADRDRVFGALTAMRVQRGMTCIIQGGARGADALAREWAQARGFPCLTMDAPWSTERNRAGPIRNGWMLEFVDVKYCVAFPGGTGTEDMVWRCKMANITVWQL